MGGRLSMAIGTSRSGSQLRSCSPKVFLFGSLLGALMFSSQGHSRAALSAHAETLEPLISCFSLPSRSARFSGCRPTPCNPCNPSPCLEGV
eukprot:1145219-Pelagomonas_calceolata.AAC.7